MNPSSKNDPGRRLVRHALTNIFLFPGLGSVQAGRYAAGVGQLIIFLAGSVALVVWLCKILKQYYGMMYEDVKVENVGWIGITGGILMVLSWLWSVMTSLSIFAQVSKLSAPPILTSAPADKHTHSRFAEAMAGLPQWQHNGEVISRTYEFKDFLVAMQFVNAVAQVAEQVQHHPDVDIRWNKVTLALTTHDKGGLTAKDFAMAQQCDKLAQR